MSKGHAKCIGFTGLMNNLKKTLNHKKGNIIDYFYFF